MGLANSLLKLLYRDVKHGPRPDRTFTRSEALARIRVLQLRPPRPPSPPSSARPARSGTVPARADEASSDSDPDSRPATPGDSARPVRPAQPARAVDPTAKARSAPRPLPLQPLPSIAPPARSSPHTRSLPTTLPTTMPLCPPPCPADRVSPPRATGPPDPHARASGRPAGAGPLVGARVRVRTWTRQLPQVRAGSAVDFLPAQGRPALLPSHAPRRAWPGPTEA